MSTDKRWPPDPIIAFPRGSNCGLATQPISTSAAKCTCHQELPAFSHSATIAMKHLVLSLGLKTCTLPAHELDNHPGSLLSELARCKDADGAELEAVASGCCTATPTETVGNISTLRLDSLPSFPFADWPAALDIVPLLYR